MPTSAPALQSPPAHCLLALLCTIGVLGVLGAPQPGQLRIPRVYNALVTSGDELAPSRAYPVLQPLPVIHDTPFGYSVHGLPSYAPLNLQERPNFEFRPTDSFEEKATTQQQQTKTPGEIETTQAIAETTDIDKKADETTTPKNSPQKPPSKPEENNPVKLNEFGLPQSLIPIQHFNNERARFPIYDPFNPYNPYFGQVYNNAPLNPYNPYVPYHQVQYNSYPYNPYGFQPPFYNIPQETPQETPQHNPYGPPQQNPFETLPTNQQQPQDTPQLNAYGPPQQNSFETQQSDQPSPPQPSADSESKLKNDPNSPPPPPALEDLDIKNYKKVDPVIGDVPPPPLPKGGLKN